MAEPMTIAAKILCHATVVRNESHSAAIEAAIAMNTESATRTRW